MKNGLILSVGKGLAIPPEAIVVKGDSLYVYAGFIDGLSRTGVTKPKEEGQRERVPNPGNPPPERAGITPQIDVRNLLSPADKSVEDFRNSGFTVAQVVPYGVLLPGSAAVVSFNGKAADQTVLWGRSAFYSELTANQGVYPSNILGIMAKWRELYRQAAQSKAYDGVYAANRAGLPRPETNRILEAFYPVVDKTIPVLFKAEKLLDVHRVLTLKSDLGFSLVLAGVKEGWDVTDKIKSSGAKVFLSIDLPEEVKEEKKKEPENNNAERIALEKRRADFIAKYDGQASVFQKAGIKFGFSTIDSKASTVHANLRRMIKAGLTEDQALAALTTSPAELLGMSDRLGSIDNGKIANLVLSDKPYFDEKSKVKFVFVDGVMFKMENKEAKKDANAKVEIAGTWTVISDTPQGKSETSLNISKNGETYGGKVTSSRTPQPIDLTKVELDGNSLKYSYAVTMGSQSLTIEVDATVEGDTFKGTATAGSYGSFPVEGKKDPKKNN